ncbi:hypothetical protein L596_029659 [Steinernema carpocapsae]|nr:hypothetical protein L596_029659 [Steinernema carpocapsae]
MVIKTRRHRTHQPRRYRRQPPNLDPQPPLADGRLLADDGCKQFRIVRNTSKRVFRDHLTPKIMFGNHAWRMKFNCTDFSWYGRPGPWFGVTVELCPEENVDYNFCAKIEVVLQSWKNPRTDLIRVLYGRFQPDRPKEMWPVVLRLDHLNNEELGYSVNGNSIVEMRVTYI